MNTRLSTDAVSLRVLRAAISDLGVHVLPNLTEDAAKIHGGLIYRALKYVEARESALMAACDERASRARKLNGQIARLFDDAGVDARTASENFQRLLDLAEGVDERATAARRCLSAAVENETVFRATFDPECRVGASDSYRGGRQEGSTFGLQDLTQQSLARWVRDNWREERDAEVVDVARVPGGFSKTTAFFTLRTRAGDRRLVLRRDLPIPLMGKSVVTEYPLLRKLHAAGFPVAAPLCLEPRSEFLNGAFMVSERMPGSVDFMSWKDDRDRVLAIARQLAQALARLHGFSLEALGYPADVAANSARDHMEREIDRWHALYRAKMRDEQPMLELAFSWLKKNIPVDLANRQPALLHGDVGFHNLLVHDDRVSALLDWEFHHLGDPVEELNYAKLFVEQVMPWSEFMELYEAAGGIRYPEDDTFYTVWSATRNPIGCVDSVALFEDALPDEIQLAVAGYVFGPRLQLAAGRKIVESVARTHE